jgi:hypothetical protein
LEVSALDGAANDDADEDDDEDDDEEEETPTTRWWPVIKCNVREEEERVKHNHHHTPPAPPQTTTTISNTVTTTTTAQHTSNEASSTRSVNKSACRVERSEFWRRVRGSDVKERPVVDGWWLMDVRAKMKPAQHACMTQQCSSQHFSARTRAGVSTGQRRPPSQLRVFETLKIMMVK